MTSRALEPGRRVDQYKIRALVGRGGMGEVYLARDVRLGRKVALKVILNDQLSDKAVKAFLDEARVTARFSHPHIVGIYGAGEVDGRPYLALEFLEGSSLRAQLEQERLPVGRVARIGLAVAEALAEAHDAGVLHRDLKPENIFLPRDGRVRVVDFGLARATTGGFDAASSPLDTQLAGTPLYMAPEQWRRKETSAAADVWAFGLCLYEMLGGAHPFAEDFEDLNIARLRATLTDPDLDAPELPESDGIPPDLVSLVRDCLAPDPAQRPSARQLVRRLDGLLHHRAAEDDSEEPPFRGLLPFTEEHADQFYGREGELALFVERLREEATLPVVGPSGAGKSSFVFAGVVPRLREQAYWTVVRMRPGRTPFETLAARVVAKEARSTARVSAAHTLDFAFDDEPELTDPGMAEAATRRSPVELAARLKEAPGTLHLVLAELAETQRSQVLLVVDQLEELYTLVPDEGERKAFMSALCLAADDPAEPVRVVFTVRDDFLGRLAETPAAAEALARVALIRPLGREALTETLIRPLQSRGYRMEEGLVEEMVDQVVDSPAGLPLLQFAARMLWDRRDRGRRLLTWGAYEQIGGVAGALARHGDEVLAGMRAERQEIARQLLLRLLTAEGTRRTVTWAEAVDGLSPEHAEPTLERLVGSRLLVVHEGGERLVELAHESLVGSWSRLRRWHAESREEVRLLAELEDAARLWERRGKRPGELWSGETLLDAERVVVAAEMPMSSRAQTFLEAATRLRDRAVRNRRRLATAGVAALALIALGSTGASFEIARQRRAALSQTEAATAARAEALSAGAHAAYASGDTLAARAQLRSALSLRDSASARALWWAVDDDVVVWSLDTPYRPHGHALAADGEQAAVAASDGILRVFDNRTGAVRSYRTTGDAGLSAAAVDDGRVAAVDFDGAVWVWEGEEEARQLSGVPADTYPYHLDFLPDGRLLLYVYWPDGFDTAVLTWDGADGEPTLIRTTQGHGRMAVDPSGHWLVSGNPRGGSVSLHPLDGPGRKTLGTLGQRDRVGRFAWSADGKKVASVGRSVVIFDAEGGELARFEGHPAAVRGAGFLDGGDRLAAVGADGTVRVWSVEDGTLLRTVDPGLGEWDVIGASVLPDGRVHLSRERGLMHLDLRRAGARAADRGHVGWVEGVAFDPDGVWVATGGQDGIVRVWDREEGTQLAVLGGAEGAVADLDVDPSGRWLAAGTGAAQVAVWSTEDWQLRARLDHPSDLKGTLFTQDALVTVDYGGRLRSWPLAGLEDETPGDVEVGWIRDLETNAFDLDLVPGGDRFVASDFYGRLHTGRLGSDAPLTVIEAHRTQVHSVVARADGSAVSIGFDDVIQGWDLRSGERLFRWPTEGASGLGVHPEGRLAVLGDGQGTAVLDLETGDKRWFHAPDHGPSGVRFTADGSAVAVGDDAGALWLIDVDTGLPRWRTVFAEGPRVLNQRGWAPDAPAAGWAALLEGEGVFADALGDILCAVLEDDSVVRWDRSRDVELARHPVPEVREVVAQPGRCLVRTREAVLVVAADGVDPLVPAGGPWRRLVDVGDGWAAATEARRWWLVPPAGDPEAREGVGVTAVRRDGERLWIGTSDGGIEAVLGGLGDPEGERLRPSWVRPPASAVVAVERGPGETVFSAHQDGQLVLWDIASGAHLVDRKLHGPPIRLERVRNGLIASTAVGDVERLDLTLFEADRCSVLASVEAAISTVWVDEGIALAGGSAPCP